MIIYGTNGTHVRTAPLAHGICPGCTTPDALQGSVYSRYVHVYGIPVLPYSKPAVAQCGHCLQSWEPGGLPVEARAALLDLRKQTRTPVWQWAGLALLVLGIGWAGVASARDDRDNVALLAAPRAGDIYTVHDSSDDPNYSLLKVVRAQGNTVQLVGNEYQIQDSHPLNELNAPAKYSKEPFELTQLELQIMQKKGQITDVDRLSE